MSLVSKAFSDLRRIKKEAKKNADACREAHPEYDVDFWIKKGIKGAANEINQVCDLLEDPDYGGAILRLLELTKKGEAEASSRVFGSKQTFMITIRPDETKVDFFEFKKYVEWFITRKCFVNYKYSFEQKGECVEDIGKGFHVHIVANMKQRSKSEVLRDTLSSWKEWIDKGYIASNCIDVITTKNGEALVENYLLEYKSDDGHKEVTQSWDELWRTGMSLQRLYVSE